MHVRLETSISNVLCARERILIECNTHYSVPTIEMQVSEHCSCERICVCVCWRRDEAAHHPEWVQNVHTLSQNLPFLCTSTAHMEYYGTCTIMHIYTWFTRGLLDNRHGQKEGREIARIKMHINYRHIYQNSIISR